MVNDRIEFYGGSTSKPYEVSVEIDKGVIYIIDIEQSEKPLYFALKECHYNKNNTKAFIYLNKQSTAYIVMDQSNSHWQEVKTAVDAQKTGFKDSLMRLNWLTLTGILVGMILLIYLSSTFLVPAVGMKLITPKKEIAMGESLYKSMIEDENVDTPLTRELGKFADGLHLSEKYKIKITVINDVNRPMYNAFAMPGGHIVVYMSLLDKMNSSGELVALLSHESSHVNYRHSLQSMLTGISSSMLISIVTSGMGSSGALLSNANSFRMMSYSRNLEREADEQGMNLMVKNQINPKGMKSLMESLQKIHDDVSTDLSFMSSHPLTKERIKNAEHFIATHDTTNTVNPDRELMWKHIKTYLLQ